LPAGWTQAHSSGTEFRVVVVAVKSVARCAATTFIMTAGLGLASVGAATVATAQVGELPSYHWCPGQIGMPNGATTGMRVPVTTTVTLTVTIITATSALRCAITFPVITGVPVSSGGPSGDSTLTGTPATTITHATATATTTTTTSGGSTKTHCGSVASVSDGKSRPMSADDRRHEERGCTYAEIM
jgi:hypothetical protein